MAKDKHLVTGSEGLSQQTTSDDIESFTNSSGVVSVGSAVYISGNGSVGLAVASNTSQYAIGLVFEVTDATNCRVITSGLLGGFGSGMTAGTKYYLSSGTPGALTTTRPTGSNYGQLVGIAYNATDLLVLPPSVNNLTGYSFPVGDGSDNQVLVTNGSGVLAFENQSGGGGGGGISFDGSTANGVLSYKDSDEASVESNLTFDGTDLTVAGTGSIYVDKIRRASDSGTTTKILLNDEAIKLYAGDSTNNICTVDSTGLKIDNGSLETATIDYTDGDLSMTIADGGKVTFAAGFAVGSDAAGDILYHNGTSYVRLAKGTADQVLTMNDAATAPNWETASGGGGSSESTITTTLTYDDDAFDLGTSTYTAKDTVVSALAVAANKTITGVAFDIPAAWTLNSGTASGEIYIKLGDVWYKPQYVSESYGYLSESAYWLKNHTTGIYGFVGSRQSSTGSGVSATVKVKGVTNDTSNSGGYLTAGSVRITIYYT